MKKLEKYATKSSLMDILIVRDNEKFKFNLSKELRINEAGISKELLKQPTTYGFLTMLRSSLDKMLSDAKVDEKKAYAKAYIRNKKATNKTTGRPNSDDLAKALSEVHPGYVRAQRLVIDTKYDLNRIDSCIKAFEQRASMLQTLSANIRKEIQ